MSHEFYSRRKLNDDKRGRTLSTGSTFASDGKDMVRAKASSQVIDYFGKREYLIERASGSAGQDLQRLGATINGLTATLRNRRGVHR
jgi:hypothetical protein